MPVKAATRYLLVIALGALFFWCEAGLSSELVVLGEAKLMQGKLNQAEDYLVRALEKNPMDPRALSSLGRVYFHQARYRQAEEKLLLAMGQMPVEEWITCWNNVYLGRINIIYGAFENASLRLQEASGVQATANCSRESEKYLAYIEILQFSREGLTDKATTACCVIHYARDDLTPEKVSAASGLVQGYFEKIERLLSINVENGPIHIYLYPANYQYKLWAARKLLAAGLGDNKIHVFHRDAVDDGHLEHEMVHAMTASMLEGGAPTPLLNEGMAEFVVEDLWGLPLDAWVKAILQKGYFIPITRLADSQAFWETNPILSYTQAGAFVKFLVDRYGTGRLFEVAAGESSWENAYGLTLAELEVGWLTHLDALPVKPVDTDLLNYRLSLGDRYRAAGFSLKGLPWVGVTYEVAGDRLVIKDVAPNGPAQQAGLRAGDLITKIDGVPVNAGNRWLPAATVHQKEIGEVVSVVIERGVMEKSFNITLGSEQLNQQKR